MSHWWENSWSVGHGLGSCWQGARASLQPHYLIWENYVASTPALFTRIFKSSRIFSLRFLPSQPIPPELPGAEPISLRPAAAEVSEDWAPASALPPSFCVGGDEAPGLLDPPPPGEWCRRLVPLARTRSAALDLATARRTRRFVSLRFAATSRLTDHVLVLVLPLLS